MIPAIINLRYLGIGLALAAVLGVYVYVASLHSEIESLNEQVRAEQISYVSALFNYTTCKNSLLHQNNVRLKLQSDLDQNMIKLQEWKNKPEGIKYKVIYKYLIKEDNATCEDVVNSINGIDLNSL